jgi:dTDP-L-rhamnose 4-epimerase
MKILVTGGAGFIGSFLVDALVAKGHDVVIYDNLESRVHRGKIPSYLNKYARFIKGDICDREKLDKALRNIDVIFHEAAMLGLSQSMYEIEKYTRVNTFGAAVLLDLIVNKHRNHIQKMLVAASMSEYGEGLYACKTHGEMKPNLRSEEQLKKQQWEPICLECKKPLVSKPTPETTPLECNSIYAINKRDHEDMFINVGKAFNIPTVALRYFNVYGPRQSLSNPYTGVAAIFMSRLKAKHNPVIFEDGLQSRDFVSVHDIVSANITAMKNKNADYKIFNVGSGNKITVRNVAETLMRIFASKNTIEVTNKFRKGDIRHCSADISKIKKELGWKPKIIFAESMNELVEWGKSEESKDLFDQANNRLKEKGIL